MGVDVVAAEGQALGLPLSFGGPGIGLLATRASFMRKIPGRLIGKTTEVEGRVVCDGLHSPQEGFVMTLQAREQHIRREGALSNICSNQANCALHVLLYLTYMGARGLRAVAENCVENTQYLRDALAGGPARVLNSGPVYNELLVEVPDGSAVVDAFLARGWVPPVALEQYYPDRPNQLLVAVSESVPVGVLDQVAVLLGGGPQ
jgi:glycine dehydrogenase subunit 1